MFCFSFLSLIQSISDVLRMRGFLIEQIIPNNRIKIRVLLDTLEMRKSLVGIRNKKFGNQIFYIFVCKKIWKSKFTFLHTFHHQILWFSFKWKKPTNKKVQCTSYWPIVRSRWCCFGVFQYFWAKILGSSNKRFGFLFTHINTTTKITQFDVVIVIKKTCLWMKLFFYYYFFFLAKWKTNNFLVWHPFFNTFWILQKKKKNWKRKRLLPVQNVDWMKICNRIYYLCNIKSAAFDAQSPLRSDRSSTIQKGTFFKNEI